MPRLYYLLRNRMSVVLVFTLLILPSAQPFAAGSSSSWSAAAAAASNLSPHVHPSTTVSPVSSQTSHVLPRNSRSTTVAVAGASTTARPLHNNENDNDHNENDALLLPPSSRRHLTSRLGRFLPQRLRLKEHRPHAATGEYSVSLPSRLLYQYATPLIHKARRQGLDMEDAMEIPDSRKMNASVSQLSDIYQRLRQSYRKTLEERKAAGTGAGYEAFLLTKALLIHQKRMIVYTAVLRLINTFIQAFPALLVARLLRLIEAGDVQPVSKALTAALVLVSVLSVKMIVENHYFHNVIKYSTQVRGSLAGLIFDKALRLPGGGSGISHQDREVKGAIGAGGVLNIMQSDASIVEGVALQIHTTWDGILQLAIYISLLYRFLGNSVFYGIAVLLATIPVNSITLRILGRLAKHENEAKDARNKRTAESISNMKLLKLFGWEDRFADDIRSHRADELSRHVSRGIVRATNSAISNAVPSLVLVVTLTAYARAGKPIVASTIFTAISLFNQLRFPLFFYPMLVDSLANGRNAMLRIANFLSAEEITPYVEKRPPLESGGGKIEMKHGNFLWSVARGSDSETKVVPSFPALANVNLCVEPGEIVAIVGSVGTGKSALIKGLLGELSPVPSTIMQTTLQSGEMESLNEGLPLQPKVVTHGNIAYCSQEAWLPKGTIRDAIVFGRDYDEARYFSAIFDAGLDNDITDSSLKKGQLSHDTDVGEHGSALSGGQRARVALARALYAGDDTQVFLLDDVLAALDANVGSIVFERLTKRLRKQKAAVVLVTNDPSIPRRCNRVVMMGKVESSLGSSCSTVVDQGSYDELVARGRKLSVVRNEKVSKAIKQRGDESVRKANAYPDDDRNKNNMTDASSIIFSSSGHSASSMNDTIPCGYVDPEYQANMEKCPDMCNAESIPTASIHEYDDFDLVNLGTTEIIAVYNDTEVSTTGSVGSVSRAPPLEKAVPSENKEENSSPVSTKTLSSVDSSMSSGAVALSEYMAYFKAVRSPALIVMMLASYLTVNGAQFFQQYTVAKWSEAASSGLSAAMGASYLQSLVNAAAVVSVVLWFRSLLLMKAGLRASDFFHSQMLKSVFRAPLSFFSATSSGTLLSRFGKELETVDRGVPDSIGSVLFCFLQIFTSIGALAGVVHPSMILPLGLVAILYGKTMSMFKAAARDLKRAETKSRSPIFTHLGEALRGSETIRSIPGAGRNWSGHHRFLMDRNLSMYSTAKVLDRWLSMRLENLGNMVVFTSAIASVFLTRAGKLGAGSAGWGLTQSLSITGLLTWAVRCLTDLETNMMSTVRVRELTDLDSEAVDLSKLSDNTEADETASKKPRMPREYASGNEALKPLLHSGHLHAALAPADSRALIQSGWPWRGNIAFSNVSMRYTPSVPLVLRDVTLGVPAGTTLGIVGRTGSGKSSLLLTLFRMVELEKGGSIEIDGVDIRSVDLKALRRSLAIIPQEPTLFQGDIAYNLDATGASWEAEMWAALEAASPSLAAQFRLGDGLQTVVSEGGNNLSVGQRQLICLARALLRKSKILVLDEATSSVDAKTDQEVQETIRREFVDKGVTVMTVAHRLDTVLGYDKIAVLSAGRIVEYGSPAELLDIEDGELRKLVEADRRNKARGGAKTKASSSLGEAMAKVSV